MEKTTLEKIKKLLKFLFSIRPSNVFSILICWVLIPFFYFIFQLGIGEGLRTSYPKVSSGVGDSDFSEGRVRQMLKEFEKIGNKGLFSENNEITKEYILTLVNEILNETRISPNNNLSVEVVIQPFPEDWEYTLHPIPFKFYTTKPPENIYVKVEPYEKKSDFMFMISTHYDTVGKSPGSSDTIAKIGLHGAKVFGLHPFSRKVKRLVNLEGMASIGKSLLFRSFPSSAPLEIMSATKVKANSVGEDLLGLTGSGTDWTVYTEELNIPGFDFAYTQLGFFYHTKNDLEKYIESGAIQLLGETIGQFFDVYIFSENSPLVHPNDIFSKSGVYYWSSFADWGLYCFSEVLMIFFSLLSLIFAFIISIFASFPKYWLSPDEENQRKKDYISVYSSFQLQSLGKEKENSKEVEKSEETNVGKSEKRKIFIFFIKNYFVMLIYYFFYLLSLAGGFLFALLSSLIGAIISPMAYYRNYIFTSIVFGVSTVTGIVLFQFVSYTCVRLKFKKHDVNYFTNERWTSYNLFTNTIGFGLSMLGPLIGIRLRLSFMLLYCIFSNFLLCCIIVVQYVVNYSITSYKDIRRYLKKGRGDTRNFEGLFEEKKMKISVSSTKCKIEKEDQSSISFQLDEIKSLTQSPEKNFLGHFSIIMIDDEIISFSVGDDDLVEFEKLIKERIGKRGKGEENATKTREFFRKVWESVKIFIVKYKAVYLTFMWLMMIFQWMAYESNMDIFRTFVPLGGRVGGQIPISSGILSAVVIVFLVSFAVFIIIPTLHRAGNFLKLFWILLFFSFIFTIIMGSLFPFSKDSPKWLIIENYYNSSDMIDISLMQNGEKLIQNSNYGNAYSNISSFDIEKLYPNHPLFDYYKEKTGKAPKCITYSNKSNFCMLDIEEESFPRVRRYNVTKLSENEIFLEINYNRTMLSMLRISGEDFNPLNDVNLENKQNIKFRNGSFFKTNVISTKWSGRFSVRNPLNLEIMLIYNRYDEIELLNEMLSGENWYILAAGGKYFRGIFWIVERINVLINP